MWEELEGRLSAAGIQEHWSCGHTARQVNAIDGRNKKDLQLAERDVKNQLNAMRSRITAESKRRGAGARSRTLTGYLRRVSLPLSATNAFESDGVKRSHLIDEGENAPQACGEAATRTLLSGERTQPAEADVDALNRAAVEARANMHLSVTEAVFKEAKADSLEADAVYARSIGDKKAASGSRSRRRRYATKPVSYANRRTCSRRRQPRVQVVAEAKNRVESINEAVGNDAVTRSARQATETVETVRGGTTS